MKAGLQEISASLERLFVWHAAHALRCPPVPPNRVERQWPDLRLVHPTRIFLRPTAHEIKMTARFPGVRPLRCLLAWLILARAARDTDYSPSVTSAPGAPALQDPLASIRDDERPFSHYLLHSDSFTNTKASWLASERQAGRLFDEPR